MTYTGAVTIDSSKRSNIGMHQGNIQVVFGIFVFGIGISDVLSQSFHLWYIFGPSLSLVIHLCLCKLYLYVFENIEDLQQ